MQNSQAGMRLSSSGYSCVHIYCMYIFLLDLAVVDWPWFKWDYSSIWVRDSLVAMYTFIVGPWLPTSNAISEGLRHKPNHPKHWLQLCLLLHSSKLQKFHLFPCNCELEHLSVCSRCAHTCQKNHLPDTCHQD